MRNKVTSITSLALLLILAISFKGAVAAQSTKKAKPTELYSRAERCRKTLYKSNRNRKYRHHWLSCIQLYQKIPERFPKSDQAAWSLYRCGQMYTSLYQYSGRQDDLDSAVEHYRKLAGGYRDHRLADDAQYRVGRIFEVFKKDPTQAYVEFLKVDIQFPTGDMRPKARKKLDELAAVLRKKDRQINQKKAAAPATELTLIKNIRHWSTPTYTRVVIDLERPVKYESHLLKADPDLKKPRRLYVDLNKTYVTSDIESSIPIGDGLLKRARAGQHKRDEVRVVMDINNIGGYKIFHLYDPFRIVVDVRGTKRESAERQKISKIRPEKTRSARKGIRKVKKPDKDVSLARQLGLNVKRIVIDPGHGGKDPGTYLKGGIKEKHIVLNLARILERKIESSLGIETILTRQKDVFLSLEKRTAFANIKKADLFISLHINAHHQRSIRGLETYFLNMATDERAVKVAARENATSQKNISDLQTILSDLMLNTKISESSKLAHEVQNGMLYSTRRGYKQVKSLGVKQAPFYVLIGAEMPAVLVETGFITNPTERKRLQSSIYQKRLAEGIAKGIASYIKSIGQVYSGG
ncbi:N-acetylmuramoyl-L-alanine amidase [Thermodesulfobacteriota bacterium]